MIALLLIILIGIQGAGLAYALFFQKVNVDIKYDVNVNMDNKTVDVKKREEKEYV